MKVFIEMENVQKRNPSGEQQVIAAEPLQQRRRSRGQSDIFTQRLKNRERQRRYRARKRLEENSKLFLPVNQPAEPEVNYRIIGITNNFPVSVPCARGWKKDARRANACKDDVALSSNPAITSALVTGEGQSQCLPFKSAAAAVSERESHSERPAGETVCETQAHALGKRDWKAAARLKMSNQ